MRGNRDAIPGGYNYEGDETMKALLPVLVGVTLAFASAVGGADETDKDVHKLSIERKSLKDALNDWAQQTGYQLIAEIKGEFVAPRVEGRLTAQEALERLLKGTPLTYQWMGERLVAVKEKSLVVPAALQTTEGDAKQRSLPIARFNGEGLGGQRLAASDPATGGGSSSAARGVVPDTEDRQELEEIFVTGTHIRSRDPAPGSKVLTIGRADMDKSGYATVQDVLRSLPQNFGGGASEDNNLDTLGGNFNSGSAVNLRGLGIDSTLVLINGRRQPASGTSGSFVDISSIPTAAVERVEVLTDGASAIYGSDAVGGVVNFVLRRDYDGAETELYTGTYGNDATEYRASQLLGENWSSGNVLVGYQYYQRDALARRDRERAASDDLTRFGGRDFRTTGSNPGNILDPFTGLPAFAIPGGQDGTQLSADDLIPGTANLDDSAAQLSDLLPKQTMHSAFANFRQELGDRFEFFTEGRFSNRETVALGAGQAQAVFFMPVPSSNAFFVDPFGGSDAIFMDYNFARDLGPLKSSGRTDTLSVAAGLNIAVGQSWRVQTSVAHGEEETSWRGENFVNQAELATRLASPDPAVAFNPFADGSNTSAATLDAIRATQSEETTSETQVATIIVDGPLFHLGSRAVRLALGADYRDDSLDALSTFTGVTDFPRELGRHVAAAFAEVVVPVIGSDNAVAGLRQLDVSLAGRYEDYSDRFGTTFNPKVGLSWKPIDAMKLRASWGTSFKAPRLAELLASPARSFDFFTTVEDPAAPGGFSSVLMRFGNNPELEEETATTWTAGLDFASPNAPGLLLSATYFDIEYEDRIAAGGPANNPFGVLLAEDEWAPIINRMPTQEEVDAICNGPFFFPLSPTDCTTLPAALIDLRLRNLSVVNTQGIDLDLRQSLELPRGKLTLGLNGTYVLEFSRAVTTTSPVIDVVDTLGNVPDLRLRGEATWSYGGFAATAFLNYTGSYHDNLTPDRPIDSWSTLDLTFAYTTGESQSWFGGLRLSVTIANAFDEEPPFVNTQSTTSSGYDSANADLYGRILSAQVRKSW